jgi:hypothetical protein
MRWHDGKKINGCGILLGKSKEGRRLENIGVDRKIILKWMLNKYDVNFFIRIHGENEGLL